MNKILKTVLLVLFCLISAILIISCGNTGPDREEPQNAPPKVFISNVPPAGTHFTANAELFWYGTDEDGFIIAYEYAVIMKERMIDDGVDVSSFGAIKDYALNNIQKLNGGDCDPTCWNVIWVDSVDNATKQTIRLVAGLDPEDSVAQYFFVRAIDDDSTRSIMDFRLYSRSNHQPNSHINTFATDASGTYEWSDTTSTWKGISLSWFGSDSLDYDNQDEATFEFYYQLFGPYDDPEILNSAGIIDTLENNKLLFTSFDSLTSSHWVEDRSGLFFNLFKEEITTTTTGIFVLKVTARDDAFAADPTPAFTSFEVTRPGFEKDILIFPILSDPSVKQAGDFPALLTQENIDNSFYEFSYLPYLKSVFSDAGYPNPDFIEYLTVGQNGILKDTIDKELIAKYKLIIIFIENSVGQIDGDLLALLTDYMDLGGNVWLWGPWPFTAITSVSGSSLNGFGANDIPVEYFNVHKIFSVDYLIDADDRISDFEPPYVTAGEEFIGASALPGSGLTDIEYDPDHLWAYIIRENKWAFDYCVDSSICIDLDTIVVDSIVVDTTTCIVWNDSTSMCDSFLTWIETSDTTIICREYYTWACDSVYTPKGDFPMFGVPFVGYLVRDVFSEPLFLFNSYYGDNIPDSVRANVHGFNGKVVAIRYDARIFKSAVFNFSFWGIKHNDLVNIVQNMVPWFDDRI